LLSEKIDAPINERRLPVVGGLKRVVSRGAGVVAISDRAADRLKITPPDHSTVHSAGRDCANFERAGGN
jgi:hypothetical protein